MQTYQNLVFAGHHALKSADWEGAKAHFEKALREAETPESHDGLGIALWWLNEIDNAHHHRTMAYTGYKERGDFGIAAVIASWLAREQVFLRGNFMAMQGWFARAEWLISQLGPCPEREWCSILRASMMENPLELERIALKTLESARLFGDSNMEAFALAFGGMAQVALGQVSDGMARLDEAMAMVTSGEVADFMTTSEVFCVMLSACDTAGDLVRSDQWCQIALEFAQRHHCPFLSAYCRTTYGSLLGAMGRWQDAESVLMEAIRAFEMGHKGLRVHAVIKLADLRVSQGKFEEAAVMLAGLEDQGAAQIPLARLHLAKGEAALAKAVLEQGILSDNRRTSRQLPALFLLVEIFLAMDNIDAAHQIITKLTTLAQQSPLLKAQAELAKGRVDLHAGNSSAAVASFNAALRHLQTYEQSLLAGQVRLRMAQALQKDDPPGAMAWAKAALATFERIGAAHDAAEAGSLLRKLGVSGSTPRLQKPLTPREKEILAFVALGLTNREIGERLVISAKTVEHHVSRILGKLNLRSRVEATAFAASGKLDDLIK